MNVAYQLVAFPNAQKTGHDDRKYKTLKGAVARALKIQGDNDLVVIRENITYDDCSMSGAIHEYWRDEMQKTIYVRKDDVDQVLKELTKQQMKANVFVNVAEKEYLGTKYDDVVRLVVG